MHCLVCATPTLPRHVAHLGSFRSKRGRGPIPPFKNKTLAVATHHLVRAPPLFPTQYSSPCTIRSIDGSLPSKRGPAHAPPLNNKTLGVATNHLVCASHGVCTALCVCTANPSHTHSTPHIASLSGHVLCCTRGRASASPLNNKTTAVAVDRLVCTANPSKKIVHLARFAQRMAHVPQSGG